jgi:hypothetical protein
MHLEANLLAKRPDLADERAVRAEVSSGGEEPGDHRGVARVPDGALPDRCAGHERVATMTQ